jgi:signal transduction histidine kinase
MNGDSIIRENAVKASALPQPDPASATAFAGTVGGATATAHDESGLFSGESVLNTLKLIFAGAPLSEVLTIIARLVEAQGQGMLCTIWLLDKDGRLLTCAAAPSLGKFVAEMPPTPVGPKNGSCGTAVHRRAPVYVTDVRSDPLWDDDRQYALRHGLRAVWSRPLVSSDGKVLGTFANHYREVRSPSTTDLRLIENASQIAGIAIERHMKEEELKRAENALSKARTELAHVSRMTTMGELVASIAHQVNQPLGAVVANANACLRWLNRKPPKLDKARESVSQIILDANRGSEVVTGIRSLLRREHPHSTLLNVKQEIREILAVLRAELGEVTVQTRLADDLPPVMADRVQLQQVLLNLMMNAIEAMKPVSDLARVLRIETMRHEEHAALVAIQDSGVGLDTGQMQKLFEPFYTTKPQGLGMGLSICRTILERHGGCLWAEANEGPGATFKFSLPFGNGGRT